MKSDSDNGEEEEEGYFCDYTFKLDVRRAMKVSLNTMNPSAGERQSRRLRRQGTVSACTCSSSSSQDTQDPRFVHKRNCPVKKLGTAVRY